MPAAPPEAFGDFSPLLGEGHAALAVSGGADSTALMHLVADWAAARHSSLRISVLTVDHGLRAAAAEEARQVADWARRRGLAHETLGWTGAHPGSGLQARARAARYGLMARWCRDNGAGVLLTAHTLDDQAETVLMRLRRTASPESLAGIARQGGWGGVKLFRPLLGARREALRGHLREIGQPWIEDPSNDDPRFERVRIRQELPALAARGITPERLARLAEASARGTERLERYARQWATAWLREEEAGYCVIPLKPLLAEPEALRQRLLGLVLRHYGGARHPPEPEELRRVAGWAAGGGPVRRTLAGAVLGRRGAGLWVAREAGRIPATPLIVPDTGHARWDGRFRIAAPPGSTVAAAGAQAPDLGEGVPIFARRAYPVVTVPAGAAGEVHIAALTLT